MGTTIPTLSSIGWVSTIEDKGDHVLSYFITSEYSQSVLYYGEIASLQWLVQRYGHDEGDLEQYTTETLEALMRRYFGDSTNVTVRVKERDPEKPNQLTIQFYCIIRDNGREVSLGRRVEYIDGKLVKIVEINNG